MPESLLLPDGARLVHIGPHKTGTTAIQVAMTDAREALLGQGVYYPRGPHRRRKAGWALGLPARPAGTPVPPIEHWEKLVAEIATAPGARVCVSNEDFGRARPEVVNRIVRDLGDERVHVVAVARRLDLYLPSQWQERVKAGEARSFEGWLEVVLGDNPRHYEHRNVWSAHDIAALVRRWVDVVGAERFTLLIADEGDRMQLPRVFEDLLGLTAGTLRPRSDRSNRSMTLPEVELVRAINVAFAEHGWSRTDYDRFVKRAVTRSIKLRSEPAPGPRSAPLPDWALEAVRMRSAQRVEEIRGLPVRLVGDPEQLLLPAGTPPEGTEDPAALSVPVALAADAVVHAIAAAVDPRDGRTGTKP